MHHTALDAARNHPVSPGLTAQIIAIVTGRGIRWVAALRKIVAGRQPGCPAKACGAPRRKGGPALTAGEAATPPAEATRRLSQGTARRADDGDAPAAHMPGSREAEHVITMRRPSPGIRRLVTHLESITQLLTIMTRREPSGCVSP